MSRYGGLEPNTASFLTDTFSGDDSQTQFTLSSSPGSPSALIVTIEGVKQHVAAYSVSGVTLTFTAAPPTGTNNIEVVHLGLRVEVGQPAAGTIGPNETTGMQNVIQIQQTTNVTYSSGTGAFPRDDTIPQNTEGDLIMSVDITPIDVSHVLMIEGYLNISCNTNDTVGAGIFQDAIADALSTSLNYNTTSTRYTNLVLQHLMIAGTTSQITFDVRGGTPGANVMHINGDSGGRLHGGVLASFVRVTEYKP